MRAEGLPQGPFDLILADPPWRYSFSQSRSRSIEAHYPSMSQQELCDMAIPAAQDAILLLWATAPKLVEALEVMAAWNFEYKTNLVWDKQKIGMGYWFRGQHELLLVGARGKVSPPKPAARISSVLRKARGRHSAKPDAIRRWAVEAFPEARRIELFARTTAEGFTAWGNQVEEGQGELFR